MLKNLRTQEGARWEGFVPKEKGVWTRYYLMGTVGSSFLLAFSSDGNSSHLKTKFHSNPPRNSVEAATY